jgi:hypothetical protein
MIFPATAPIGNNSFLFDTTGVNTTYAQYLNQSSFVNNGYNVLFSTFDLTVGYDGLPAGVKTSELVLVDIVNGVALQSSEANAANSSVSAAKVTGNPGVWGGGGIYAIGFQTSPSNIKFASSGEPASKLNLLNLVFITGLMIFGSMIF